jgi:hypothetical protein
MGVWRGGMGVERGRDAREANVNPEGGGKSDRHFTPYQQGVIRRYYQHQPSQLRLKLAELVGDLYLATGKSRARLWKQAAQTMAKLGISPARIQHLVEKDQPALVAGVVKELEGRDNEKS